MPALLKNLLNKLSNHPRFRILLIVAAVIVILIVLMNLLSPKASTGAPPSVVQAASAQSGQKAQPVSQQAASQYNQLANISNKQQFQQTVSSGGSAFQNPFSSDQGNTNGGQQTQTNGQTSNQNNAANNALGQTANAQNANSNASVSPQQFANQQAAAQQSNENSAALQNQLTQLQQQLSAQQQINQNNAVTQTEMTMRNSLSSLTNATSKFPTAVTVEANVPSSQGGAPSSAPGPVMITAGTIYFAVLGTALDSDQPGTPVMATIVSGPYKGARLLGGFQTVKNALVVQFNMMTLPNMDNTISINAYALDANTANNAIATSVDNHYLLRYGMLLSASFLQGFGNAYQNYNYTCPPNAQNCTIINSNGTPATTATATTAAYQGLGQIGTNLSGAAMNVFNNTPQTVTVAQGTGIGILFMSNVTLPSLTPSAPVAPATPPNLLTNPSATNSSAQPNQ